MRALLLLVLSLPLVACDRPSDDECRKAVFNMQKLRGLEQNSSAPNAEAAVRKCRANGSKTGTACLSRAVTVQEAEACHP